MLRREEAYAVFALMVAAGYQFRLAPRFRIIFPQGRRATAEETYVLTFWGPSLRDTVWEKRAPIVVDAAFRPLDLATLDGPLVSDVSPCGFYLVPPGPPAPPTSETDDDRAW